MDNDKKHLFDDPKNIKRVLHILYGCCLVLFLLGFVIHRHVVHSWENLWEFHPIYGFIGCVVMGFITRCARILNSITMNMKANLDKSAGVML